MKKQVLTKEDLIHALFRFRDWHVDRIDLLLDPEERELVKFARKCIEAFYKGSLEIEGYTKNSIWHKVNYEDMTTFPREDGWYAVRLEDGRVISRKFLKGEGFLMESEKEQITHWAELPKFKD